jgi:two-component system chemotaxis response regulator CheY
MLLEEVNILVVDDVNTMRVQIRDLLKTFGFRKIVVNSNGEEAKRTLQSEAFQLILCDWHMAPINGLEVLRFLRTDAVLKEIPFIMVTAENTKDRVIEAVKEGVDDYLVKPLTPMQIQTKVYGVLLKKKVLS